MPPRTGKTKITSICWPAWTWAQSEQTFWSGGKVRFLCGSYGQKLSFENSNITRRLLLSPWFQERWGKRVAIREDQNTKEQFDLTAGGSRIASSVGGSLLGIGGDIIVVDDPHNTEEVESDADRETASNWWREIRSTRLNDPKRSSLVVNMQRLHEEDISGQITHGEDYDEWTHFMVPMEFDLGRRCVSVLKWDAKGNPTKEWEDPRSQDGELMWPERFGAKEVAALKRDLGPYMASGRLQQMPAPSGGGIFKREWWQLWDPPDGKWPPFEYLVASLDSAFTEKEENDPSGFTLWGLFKDETGQPKVMLVKAWRKHLEMHGETIDRLPNETTRAWIRRAQPSWGLVEWVAESCRFRNGQGEIIGTVDRLLIEGKASGITAAQEMQRLYGDDGWSTQIEKVKGDKIARAHAVVPSWSQGLVYAPDREWADVVIEEMAVFPKGRYKDLTDSATQAFKHLRANGMIRRPDERRADEDRAKRLRKKPKALYPT